MPIESIDAMLTEELKDLYDAEKQLVQALPKMAKAASEPALKSGFENHLEQTKQHVSRLEKAFELLGAKPKTKPCEAMKGLIAEAQSHMKEKADAGLMDAILIASAQKVEHYEIAGYGNVKAMAEAMGNQDLAKLLESTLHEEKDADEKLTQIGRRVLQSQAKLKFGTAKG
jgi:ferritin-like metal-binding protein YciE